MLLSDFEFDLPPELIAQFPAAERTASRLLQVNAAGNHHAIFADISELLRPGDLLVVNNTRVIKARLFAQKDSGGQAEIFFERLLNTHEALCQVRVSKPLKSGRRLMLENVMFTCVGRQGQFYQLRCSEPFLDVLERLGHLPLPPYIERQDDDCFDGERYQTVYGTQLGAVAAPTAGLHFSDALLAQLERRGIERAEVTLHVGAGTFQPVRGDLEDHEMHLEYFNISEQVVARIAATQAAGGRIVAVGTTVVRTLESAALKGGGHVVAGEDSTQLFITPGFNFQVVDALVTNFHLPGSTLLMLVSAFAGYDSVMQAYQEAIAENYRFFSYGDAMWLERVDV